VKPKKSKNLEGANVFKRGQPQLWHKRKKHTSPYASNWGWWDDFVPAPVTLPKIEPTKAAAAFRAAMDQHEVTI
jgi:hypothetical protein